MTLAYVAGPYRAQTERQLVQNIREAEGIGIALWKMGYAVICPHKNTAHFGALSHEDLLKGDLEMLARCDLIVLTPRWRESAGAKEERLHAIACGLPVFEWPNVPIVPRGSK